MQQKSLHAPPLTPWQRALFLPLIILAWLAVLLVGGWLLTHIAKTVLVLVLSGIVAFALTPLVGWLARWMPRGIAIAVAYVLGFGVVGGLGALIVVNAATQVTTLVNHVPTYIRQFKHIEPQIVRALRPFGVTTAKLDSAQQNAITYLQNVGTTAAKDSLGIVSGVVSTLIDIILVVILSVYLTANGPGIARWLKRETPRTQRWRTSLMIAVVKQVVGGYIRGTLTLALLIGTLVGVGMAVLQVPYAALLGALAFFMEFIPIVGVLVSGAVCVGIAFFQGWVLALIVLGYFVVIHVIEGDVVGPRIMGKAVGIHPATALIGLVAGSELFGLWGALFAAPLAGLAQAIASAAWGEVRHGDPQAVVESIVTKETDEVARELERSQRELAKSQDQVQELETAQEHSQAQVQELQTEQEHAQNQVRELETARGDCEDQVHEQAATPTHTPTTPVAS